MSRAADSSQRPGDDTAGVVEEIREGFAPGRRALMGVLRQPA